MPGAAGVIASEGAGDGAAAAPDEAAAPAPPAFEKLNAGVEAGADAAALLAETPKERPGVEAAEG